MKIHKSTVALIMLKLNESWLFPECIVWTNIAGLNQIFFQIHIILENNDLTDCSQNSLAPPWDPQEQYRYRKV